MPERNKIKIMPEALAIKIAAGEVIERPASVVKELVENSIDAKATDISISIQDGGRKLIKVVDNGEGMTRDDAMAAFERHATSKLFKEEDLYSINTMGFRGEALSSIAAVSETSLTTKPSGEIAGTAVKVKGGKIEDMGDAGCADGTAIEVRDIFFNTPARLKFMRSVSTETGHVSDTLTRLALAYPSIRFKLYHNNASLLETSAKADLKMRIADIFGKAFLKDIIPVEAGDDALKAHGFIGKPETASPAARGLFIYVNGRWIRDRGINHAIVSGYRNCLAHGKYPFAILFITIPFRHVDVNVHPTKCEVRFKSPRGVYELVSKAIEAALSSSHISFVRPYENRMLAGGVGEGTLGYAAVSQFKPDSIFGTERSDALSCQTEFDESTGDAKTLFFSELEIIGQLWSEYLLCQRDDDFYIIDQHAAAERIAFEKLKRDYYKSRRITSQMLLLPQKVELSLQEKGAAEGALQALMKMGFDIEPFGGNTLIIRSVPDMLSDVDCRGLIKELLDELASIEISSMIEDRLDEILIRIACHSVIRGERPLSHEEAKALLENLAQADFSGNCPHGRPVIKAISRLEMEKMFKRR
ncbi:MAG: DNA mismatch repair endonuclease MutL [Deltaproteobacteria bacterium]|nr:DNA mismatch repair endonuclease MutL [Deltaproteobacteria bacterium]